MESTHVKKFNWMKAIFLVLWLFSLALIASLALVPNLIAMNTGADKMLHMLVFCMLMVWPAMTFERGINIFMSIALLLSVGFGMEVMQSFVPGRESEIMDMVFNCGGIVLGSVIGYLLRDAYQSFLPLAHARSYAHSHNKHRL